MRASVVVAVLLAGALYGAVATPQRLADASSFVLMTDSLLHDGDLRYDRADLARARALRFGDLPAGLFLLQRADGSWVYGKPAIYPLVALPWYALLGLRGFLALNGFLLAALVLLGAALLAPLLGWQRGAAVAAAVYGFSTVPAYLHWIDPFLLLTALVALGVVSHRRGRPALAGAALAAVAVYRFPYAVFLLVPLLLYVAARRGGAAARLAAGATGVAVGLAALTYLSTGHWSSYVGQRFYFERLVPVDTAAEVGRSFSRTAMLDGWRMPAVAEVVRGLVHFVFGRFAGILLYFPTFFACMLWARRWDLEKRLWLAAVFGFALLLELVVPHNRIGGEHALGNRFFILLPIGLCFIDFLAWRSWRVAGSAVLALLAVPIQQAPVHYSLRPGEVMLAWPRHLFPFEWPLAEHVKYPAEFPGLFALTDNQYYWEPNPGAVWTVGGTTADFVLVRPRNEPARVKLWSLLPEARIGDGGVERTLRFSGAAHEITLAHPMAVYVNEYLGGPERAVYWLRITTDDGVRPPAGGQPDDVRSLGVFVEPLG